MQVDVFQGLVRCGQTLRDKQSPISSYRGWLKPEKGTRLATVKSVITAKRPQSSNSYLLGELL